MVIREKSINFLSNLFSSFLIIFLFFKLRDYDSEIFAFSHRVGATDTFPTTIIQALTEPSFYTRSDIKEGTIESQPSKQSVTEQEGDNSELINKGMLKL